MQNPRDKPLPEKCFLLHKPGICTSSNVCKYWLTESLTVRWLYWYWGDQLETLRMCLWQVRILHTDTDVTAIITLFLILLSWHIWDHNYFSFVAELHQIMIISLFPTTFVHFHPSAGLISWHKRRKCLIQILFYINYFLTLCIGSILYGVCWNWRTSRMTWAIWV